MTDPARELTARVSRRDARGVTHTRFDQYHRGVKVFEGEAITHAAGDGTVTVTSALKPNLDVDVRDFMTASTNYHGARTAMLNAASALYGASSPERNAVAAAYAAINVQ